MNEIDFISKIDSISKLSNCDSFYLNLSDIYSFDSIYIFQPYGSTEAYKKFKCSFDNPNRFDNDDLCLIVLKFQNNLTYSDVRRKYDFTSIKGYYSNNISTILAIKYKDTEIYKLKFVDYLNISIKN